MRTIFRATFVVGMVTLVATLTPGAGRAESRPPVEQVVERAVLIVKCETEITDQRLSYRVLETWKGEYRPDLMQPEPPEGYLYSGLPVEGTDAVDGREVVFVFSDNGISLGKLFRHDDSFPVVNGKVVYATTSRSEVFGDETVYTVDEFKKTIVALVENQTEEVTPKSGIGAPDGIPIPEQTPFDEDDQKRADYLRNYRNGYISTRSMMYFCPTDPADGHPHAMRGFVEGWLAGVRAGGKHVLPAEYIPYLGRLRWQDDEAQDELSLDFHTKVPASDLKIELSSAESVTQTNGKLILLLTIANNSEREINTTLAHEWHGGLWPPTSLYASITPADREGANPLTPVYLVGEDANETPTTAIPSGEQIDVRLRVNWRGTGSVRALPLIKEPGKYTARFVLVFEASGQTQYVQTTPQTVEWSGDR